MEIVIICEFGLNLALNLQLLLNIVPTHHDNCDKIMK